MEIVEISCLEVWRTMSDLLDSTLETDMLARVELHLQHCAHCRAVHDGTRNALQLIGDEQVFDLPQGFSQRLSAKLDSEVNLR